MSKNRPTIEHLQLACRHVDELIEAGVTENHAIRTLELFADVYAKIHGGGSAVPHHARQVPKTQWSVAALAALEEAGATWPRGKLRVEHGTPRSHLARLVKALHDAGELSETTMSELCNRYWKLAVITVEEDARLNRIARSQAHETPEARWSAAGIIFRASPDSEL